MKSIVYVVSDSWTSCRHT